MGICGEWSPYSPRYELYALVSIPNKFMNTENFQKFMFHVLKTNFAISLNSSKLRHIRNLKNTFFRLFKVPKHILQLPSNEC